MTLINIKKLRKISMSLLVVFSLTNAPIFKGAEKKKIARKGYRDHTWWSKNRTTLAIFIIAICDH